MIKYKAKNSLKSPRFAGVKTFMRMEHVVTTDDIDFAVVGIPLRHLRLLPGGHAPGACRDPRRLRPGGQAL